MNILIGLQLQYKYLRKSQEIMTSIKPMHILTLVLASSELALLVRTIPKSSVSKETQTQIGKKTEIEGNNLMNYKMQMNK